METIEIPKAVHDRLNHLGLLPSDVRSFNVGHSNYSTRTIQPWAVMQDWKLNYWQGDIVKRVKREKDDTPYVEDLLKIIHNCQELIRQETGCEIKLTIPDELQELIRRK